MTLVKHKWSDFNLVAFNVIFGVIWFTCLSYMTICFLHSVIKLSVKIHRPLVKI